MQKILLAICFAGFFLSAHAQVIQVGHLRKETSDGGQMIDFFCKTIGMPASWSVQLSSHTKEAVVWLGNMAFYITEHEHGSEKKQQAILALESIQHDDALVRLLDEYGVSYEAPVPVRFAPCFPETFQWSDFLLKDLSTANVPVVIADDSSKALITAKRKEARKIQEQSHGGELGIRFVKKIIIGNSDPLKSVHAWVSVPGVRRREGNRFSFFNGPDIVIEEADRDEIKAVVVSVKSLQAARDFLLAKKLLVLDGNKVLISPEKTGGLRVILEEE